MVKVRRTEQAGVCAGLDVAPGSDSLRYFNGCCAECVAAGRRPRNRSSVTSSWPVCLTKLTGRSSQKWLGRRQLAVNLVAFKSPCSLVTVLNLQLRGRLTSAPVAKGPLAVMGRPWRPWRPPRVSVKSFHQVPLPN